MIDPGRKYNEFSLPMEKPVDPQIHDLISNEKEALKSLKVYVAADDYDSNMSFEQNFSEDRIKLMSELPVGEFNTKVDPFQACINSASVQIQEEFSHYIQNNNKILNCDALANSSSHNEGIKVEQPFRNCTDFENLSDTSQDGEKSHLCDVCDQIFSRRRDLALHYLTHSEREKKRVINKCDVCKKILKQCKCKKKKNKKESPESAAIESDCISLVNPLTANIVFIRAESVSGKCNVIKKELFHCSECNNVYGLLSQLKQHVLSHKRARARKEKEQKALTCNICNVICNNKKDLLNHKSTLHPNGTNLVSNNKNSTHKSQNISHSDLQPQVCTSCRTIFNDMAGLQKHFRRLGWVCCICSAYFCLKSDFNAHCLTHLNNNAFENNGESSATGDLLDKKKNNDSNVLNCKKCSKKFKFSWMLNQHKHKHILRKNHSCSRCKKSFNEKKNAFIHYLNHKKSKKKSVCRICRKKFFEKKCLKIHLKTH